MKSQVIYELWNDTEYIGKSPIKEQIMNTSNKCKKPIVYKVYLNGEEEEVIWPHKW